MDAERPQELATEAGELRARPGAELERRHFESELRASELRYRAMFDHAAIGIARQALDGSIQEVNPSLCRMLGYDEVELRGMKIKEITHPDDWSGNRALMDSALEGKVAIYGMEKRYLRKDGSVVWGALSATLVRDPAGKPDYFIGVVLDITERKRLEAELLQSQKLESLGRLAGGVAHDFNNLLTVLLSYTDMAASCGGKPAELEDCLANIRLAGERAAALTAQLLAFARKRVDTGRVVDANECLAETERMLRRLIGEHIRLTTRSARNPVLVRVDPEKLQQVLLNLSVNARDAMLDGGKLSIEIDEVEPLTDPTATEFVPGPCVRITVGDSGVGMSPEVRARLFEPFFTTKEVGQGIGMGLATAYGIVKSCHGHIAVESQLGKGTVVRVWLPRVRTAELSAEDSPGGAQHGNETVLVVEDEATVRHVVSEGLRARGYRVAEAGSPSAALAFARSHREVDLFLLDVVMPEMSGRALARELRVLRPNVSILFMSGYSSDGPPTDATAPKEKLLSKPFSIDELAGAVRSALERRS